ncbi:iron complex outermembrane recepter protein [Methylobacillus rhizosphaerae]|uniref:Iron complex outermembrane recepter protein n=1 Tax=Methylobacillus rhizosphaerae TaxID=551994 RepID=A0A238XWQ6_9PROT|nr:TonB-dependent receptor [Methylobacillus rhizosphaerae]SNR63506.1 iron complex outermembrane recepter protein [Methylobacillus rhizosphaerae]
MRHSRFHLKLIPLAVLGIWGNNALAEEVSATSENQAGAQVVSPIVVTATRAAQTSFDLPVAIDVVSKENIQDGQAQMTLSESLIRVPGITAQNRTQMSQDPQISTRGFGARSSFGVRGVRLYVDGIPLTYPDGSGQPGNVDLGTLQGIEVMRGPFSALYGNSSGGVIQLLTENAPQGHELSAGVLFGSYGTRRENVRAAGTADGLEYMINYSNYSSDGYRDHSSNKKEQGTAKFRFNLNEDTKLTTLINWFDQEANDPLGLTRAEVRADRKQATASAYRADTRVSRSQTQVGFNLEHKVNENNTINLISYVGNRKNEQYLSISPVNGNGRASLIDREFWGTDLRWTHTGELLSRPYSLSAGLTYGKMNDGRTDIAAVNGVKTGALNRDEENIATNSDQYIQAQWALLDNLDLHVGARRTKVTLEVDDNFTSGANSNGDNSGRVTYEKTTPVIGAVWKATPTLNFYANYGKGFETPTFIEAAYASTAANSTPNLSLKPSESRNFEIGTKAILGDNTSANLTLFKSLTDDEIVVSDTLSGRSSYTNAGKTKRHGAELSIESRFANNISLFGSYTLLNAKFDSDYTNALGNTIKSGDYIPGTYKTQIYGEIAWKHQASGFSTAFEARHNSKVYVNDTNSETAGSYTIFNIRAGLQQKLQNWRFSEFVRVENIFDKDYIGSVRVNDGNSRFYEPAAGRNWLLGLNATYMFQ